MLEFATKVKLIIRVSGIVALSTILSSCFHVFDKEQTLLPVDVVLDKAGTPIFYIDRYSFISRYGIRGVLITKDEVSACDLEKNKQGERSTVWGYEMSAPIKEGDTLDEKSFEEFPKEVAYGVIPPRMNQEVSTLEKNTIYHADVSVVVSRSSKVDSFRRGDLVFTIDDKGKIVSKDLQAMCDLEKSIADKKAVAEVIAKAE